MTLLYIFIVFLIFELIHLKIGKKRKLKTTLFQHKTKDIDIMITASISNDYLHIIGHDMGEQIIFFKGRDEFEYELKINKIALQQLYTTTRITINDKQSLLSYIKKNYSGNLGFSKFKNWLNRNEIPFNYHAY